MANPFDLERFVAAQDGVFSAVVNELMAGRKATHWMWFVFPQVEGLGQSPTARRYAIGSLDEARAYLEHPTLGNRLLQCVDLVNRVQDRSASEIFGSPDDLKFRSCVTLFRAVDPAQPGFEAALRKYFGGEPDARTLERLAGSA